MTLQIKDIIILNKKEFVLNSEPLNQLLVVQNINFSRGSSANGRGYYAKWELIDDSLYLIELVSATLKMEDLFKTQSPVLASWFIGDLILLSGYSVDFDGFPDYKEKLTLSFLAGIVTKD